MPAPNFNYNKYIDAISSLKGKLVTAAVEDGKATFAPAKPVKVPVPAPQPIKHCASYHEPFFDPLKRQRKLKAAAKRLKQIQRELSDRGTPIYALVGSGVSGMFGAFLADRVGLDFLYVRRESEVDGTGKAHDTRRVLGRIVQDGNVLFVDDFISAGHTYRRVERAIKSIGQVYVPYARGIAGHYITPNLTLVGAFSYDTWGERRGFIIRSIIESETLGQVTEYTFKEPQ